MNSEAPAIGGASTSNHSAWNPYAIVAPTTKRKLDPNNVLPSQPAMESLRIPAEVASDRLTNKYLQLDPPEGKVSELRKAQLAKRALEKEKRRKHRLIESGCGLTGKRKRKSLGKDVLKSVRYESMWPIHQLWLSYMSELLGLPEMGKTFFKLPTSDGKDQQVVIDIVSEIVPTFPTRPKEEVISPAVALGLNVGTFHTKLLKAEFVGGILSVRRAKNPSLVQISGIVVQETQCTFKIVNSKSQIRILPKNGTVFSFTLPYGDVIEDRIKSGSPYPTKTHRELSFDVYGDAFVYRSAERVGRKWKFGSGNGGIEMM